MEHDSVVVVGTELLCIMYISLNCQGWTCHASVGQSPASNLDTRSVCVKCLVHRLAIGQVLLTALRVFPVNVIPLMPHTHFNLHGGLSRRWKWRSLGTCHKVMLFCREGNDGQKSTFTSRFSGLIFLNLGNHFIGSKCKVDKHTKLHHILNIRTCRCIVMMFLFIHMIKRKRITALEPRDSTYEGWNFNSGNYLFTTDTK